MFHGPPVFAFPTHEESIKWRKKNTYKLENGFQAWKPWTHTSKTIYATNPKESKKQDTNAVFYRPLVSAIPTQEKRIMWRKKCIDKWKMVFKCENHEPVLQNNLCISSKGIRKLRPPCYILQTSGICHSNSWKKYKVEKRRICISFKWFSKVKTMNRTSKIIYATHQKESKE